MPRSSNVSPTTPLGRLKSLGISEPWHVALYLPESWDDYRLLLRKSPSSDVSSACFAGIMRSVETRFEGVPRTVCKILLADNSVVGFTLFGDTRDEHLDEGKKIVVHGLVNYFQGEIWLKQASIIDRSLVGRLIPKYKGKRGVIKPETVRDRILSMLDGAIPHASSWIIDNMGDALEKMQYYDGVNMSMATVLRHAHTPDSLEEGVSAQKWLEKLAALNIANTVSSMQKKRCGNGIFSEPEISLLPARSGAFPFKLTEEQKTCVKDALRDIKNGVMHRVLSGEVGTGKTAVYGLIAAVCIDGGARVAIMAPNQSLVRQIHSEISGWWPDLNPQLVTGDSDVVGDSRLFVGTTALLHRDMPSLSLVIADEQHKFSREQREKLISDGVHLLEVSATCIPRSQALIRYGALNVSKLEHCHVKKDVHTKVWRHDEKQELFERVKSSIANNSKILVIYPKREGEQDEGKLPSAEQAFNAWNKVFPGKVRLAHGGLDGEENKHAIDDMSDGRAQILISTTVVEVGINIPGLRHAVVVHAERFGLTTLHQIRGRLARDGGSGLFDLYLPVSVKDGVFKRLSVLEKTSDGFKVSEMDMRLRGFGDLSDSSSKQSGSDDTFLIGRAISIEAMDEVLGLVG